MGNQSHNNARLADDTGQKVLMNNDLGPMSFSLASDIVELVVLTQDEGFLKTLREAIGESRRLWHVLTRDKVSDLVLAGHVGILVLDTHCLDNASNLYIDHLQQQFPDLVIVVAGSRDDEGALAPLISSGSIYRFIHKPMSPERAKLFADAAVKKHEDQRRTARISALNVKPATKQNLLIVGVVGGLILLAITVAILHQKSPTPGATTALEIPARSTLPEVKSPPSDTPSVNATTSEIPAESPPVSSLAAQLERLRDKASAAAKIRNTNLPTSAEKNNLESKTTDTASPPRTTTSAEAKLAADARKQDESNTREKLLRNALERLAQDRLIEPANDSAKYYLMTLRSLDASNSSLKIATADLGSHLVMKAQQAYSQEHYDSARNWLMEASSLGYASADSVILNGAIDTAMAKQKFLANVVGSGTLTLLKSVQPTYPQDAERRRIQGWVELDFTVNDDGEVKDLAVHQSNPSGVFEKSAMKAVGQWHYKPVLHDAVAASQRARVRIRFTLPP